MEKLNTDKSKRDNARHARHATAILPSTTVVAWFRVKWCTSALLYREMFCRCKLKRKTSKLATTGAESTGWPEAVRPSSQPGKGAFLLCSRDPSLVAFVLWGKSVHGFFYRLVWSPMPKYGHTSANFNLATSRYLLLLLTWSGSYHYEYSCTWLWRPVPGDDTFKDLGRGRCRRRAWACCVPRGWGGVTEIEIRKYFPSWNYEKSVYRAVCWEDTHVIESTCRVLFYDNVRDIL